MSSNAPTSAPACAPATHCRCSTPRARSFDRLVVLDLAGTSFVDGRVRLVLDLAGTSFVDSSGLGALVAGLKRTRQAGGDLRIASAQDQVRMVLDLTNLDRILQPLDTVGDAVDGW